MLLTVLFYITSYLIIGMIYGVFMCIYEDEIEMLFENKHIKTPKELTVKYVMENGNFYFGLIWPLLTLFFIPVLIFCFVKNKVGSFVLYRRKD